MKRQSPQKEGLPLRLSLVVPVSKGRRAAISFTYRPGLDDAEIVSASIDQALSKELVKESKEVNKESKEVNKESKESNKAFKTIVKDYLDVIVDSHTKDNPTE